MAKDAKIGSLIGLVLIFIVAFVINGFTRSGRTPENDAPNTATADNTPDIDTGEHDFANWSPRQETEDYLPGDGTGDTRSVASLPGTAPTVPETIVDGDTEVSESDAAQPSLSEVFYTVCEGDNLADIAKRFYGSEEGNKRANILRLFLANQKMLTSPHEIFVGQKLLIPPLEALGSGKSSFSSSMFETVTSIGRKHLSTHDRNINQSQLYAVQEGDSLWSIASTLLGDGSRYKEISELNSVVLRDEDRLTVGMRLRVPAQ
jgi:nucleoid-associated protein YgaU